MRKIFLIIVVFIGIMLSCTLENNCYAVELPNLDDISKKVNEVRDEFEEKKDELKTKLEDLKN